MEDEDSKYGAQRPYEESKDQCNLLSALFASSCAPGAHLSLQCMLRVAITGLGVSTAHMSSRWQGRVASQLRAGTRRFAEKSGKNGGGEEEAEKSASGWIKVWAQLLRSRRSHRLPAHPCVIPLLATHHEQSTPT